MNRNDISRGMPAPRSRVGTSRVATLSLPSITVAVLIGLATFGAATYPAIRLAHIVQDAAAGSQTGSPTLGAVSTVAGVIHAFTAAFVYAPSTTATDGPPAPPAGVPGQATPGQGASSPLICLPDVGPAPGQAKVLMAYLAPQRPLR
jgi:hypothetical protein